MTTKDAPVVFVTGGSRGIGRAAALAFAKAGFDVVLTGRTVKEGDGRGHRTATTEEDRVITLPGSLESTARQIEDDYGRRALPVQMDLMDRKSVTAAVDEAVRVFGRIDVLVNNAAYEAVGLMDRFQDLRYEDLDSVLRGTRHQLLLIQSALPHLLEQPQSCVISTGSTAGVDDPLGPAGAGGWGVAHGMTKAAVHRFAPVLNAEFRDRGLRAFTVDPGFVITDQMRVTGVHEEFEKAGAPTNPPEVPAEVMAWLATSPGVEEFYGKVVNSLDVCERNGLLEGWPAKSA